MAAERYNAIGEYCPYCVLKDECLSLIRLRKPDLCSQATVGKYNAHAPKHASAECVLLAIDPNIPQYLGEL